ncbi:MAG TPA: extracellular solute-binding protein, partial [Rhodothermia bacterium]|nr:extracellular solute-binding protein [Rhodothermia bacterium]
MISSLQQFAFVSLLAAITGCSGHRSAANYLVVYSPHGKDLLSEFERGFELLHPEVDVRWLDMGSQDIFDRVRTERNNPQADVWWGAPSILFMKAAEEGLLAPFVPPWDSAVSPAEKSSGGHWYGTYRTPEVIVFNTKKFSREDVPKDWDDLLDARWKNKIVLRYPLASGTMRIIFSALIDREIKRTGDVQGGFRWLRR